MHSPNTLYVVADGGRARFIRLSGNHFHTIREFESLHIHDRSHTLGKHPPSRVQESASPTRHALEPRQDPHDKAEHAFVRHVAQILNEDKSLEPFDALVICAPSQVLADIRGTLPGSMAKKIATTIAKDLTKIPDHDLTTHLPPPSPVWSKA